MAAVSAIGDHGVIGDGRAAALVAIDGTVDWLCWPRFDSDATFAMLLHDDVSAGAWILRPIGDWRCAQEYLPDTNVLVTHFRRDGAHVTITDLMPVASAVEERTQLLPEHELVRIVECRQGSTELELHATLAPRFGLGSARRSRRGPMDLCAETPSGAFFLRGDRPIRWEADGARSRFALRAGERARFSLSWSMEGPAVLAPVVPSTDAALERTVRFWRRWIGRVRYDGPYAGAVRRSALAIKLLQYAPSGAFLAAATTSLPERHGGALNWDYRFCWLRDSAFTARCLYDLGYREEGDAFVSWLLHATRLTQPRLAVLYDVYGNAPSPERTLPHLSGYRSSLPVRVGNAADKQLQLDLHGELIDAVCAYVHAGGELDRETRRMLREFGDYVAGNWHRPDASLWEYRTPGEHHTHTKVLCWAALDGLLRLHRDGLLPRLRASELAFARDEIALALRTRAIDLRTGGYASVLGGDEPDAALFLLSWYGFEKASSRRMRATVREIFRRLSAGDGLLYRNARLRADGDGAFLACSFWGVECVADGAGTLDEAERWFGQLLRHAGPLGLLAEEVDVPTGQALGNFPQAYSHVGLISAALAIEERRARTRDRSPFRRLRAKARVAPEREVHA